MKLSCPSPTKAELSESTAASEAELDPWAMPELQASGESWSGKRYPDFFTFSSFVIWNCSLKGKMAFLLGGENRGKKKGGGDSLLLFLLLFHRNCLEKFIPKLGRFSWLYVLMFEEKKQYCI